MKFKNTPVIKTKHLTLEFIKDSDLDDLIGLLKNEEVGKTFMTPDFANREAEVKMFERFKSLSESEERFVYGIYLNGKIIGFMNDVEIDGTEVEVGYVIHPEQKNKGYATEALRAAMEEMFASGCSMVKAGAFEENPASMRVMEKAGMTLLPYVDEIEYRGTMHRCINYGKRKE